MVTDLEFPRIAIDRPAGGKVLTTEGWGVEKPLDIATFEARYPSHASSMQFIVVHNPEGAFYYGTEDRRGCGKTYSAQCTRDEVIFSDAVPASAGWIDEGTFRLPWESVAGLRAEGLGGRRGALVPPLHLHDRMGRQDARLARHPAVVLRRRRLDPRPPRGRRHAGRRPPRRRTLRQGAGHPLVLLAQPPLRHPLPRLLPGAAALRRDDPHGPKPRAHVTPYINGRLWDPAADSYKPDRGCDASCRKPDGTLYTEIYPTSKVLNTVTCPSTDIWHGKIIGLVDRLQRELGVDGIYIDQIAAAAPEPCWNENHPHPVGGGDFWYDGYRRLIGKIRDGHLQEGRILTSEENSECYIDLFDMLLVVNTPHNAENCTIRPVFPMVYSDRVITSGFTYTPLSTDLMTNGDFRYEMTKALLWGSQPGWVDPRYLMSKEAEREARFLKTLMDFRRGLHDVLYGGRFLRELTPAGDNPTMHAPGFGDDAAVLASEWQTPDGRRVYLVINRDDKAHKVSLPGAGTFRINGLSGKRIDL